MPPSSPRVLVIRRRYLGDLVLLAPLLRNLRRHWPAAHLAVLVEAAYAGVLRLNLDVDQVIRLGGPPLAWCGLLRDLRRHRFTHVFDCDNTPRTAWLARWTGAPVRVGLHHGGYPLRGAAHYTHAVHDPAAEHEARSMADYFLCALRAVDLPVREREVRLVPGRPDEWQARAVWRQLAGDPPAENRPRLLVHPGTRSALRRWPVENFATVCREAAREFSAAVVLAGDPGDEACVRAIAAAAAPHAHLAPSGLSIPQFAALAAQADVLLCHDSGPMHVAAATGTAVVALFGSQNAALWRPSGDRHIVLQAPQPCAPCVAPELCAPPDSYRTCCVRRITTGEVMTALRQVFATA